MNFQNQIKTALAVSDLSQFNSRDIIIGADECILVTPKEIGAAWNKDNLILRSVIYRKNDCYPISLSFPKFFNNLEQPGCYPDPLAFDDWTISEKLDGSTVIVSSYKGQTIIRTRGTDSAFIHENSSELRALLDANKAIAENDAVIGGCHSLIFEWLSVERPIILNYKKPELVLLAAIRHLDYHFWHDNDVDRLAVDIGVRRPEKFSFHSLESILKECEHKTNFEGYVLAFNNNQNRIKLKTAHYLFLHRIKSELSSFDKILDLFFLWGKPVYEQFFKKIEDQFDAELAIQAAPDLRRVTNLFSRAQKMLDEIRAQVQAWGAQMGSFSERVRKKQIALKIKEKYRDGLDSFAFSSLNDKVDDKVIKRLILHLIDNNNEIFNV